MYFYTELNVCLSVSQSVVLVIQVVHLPSCQLVNCFVGLSVCLGSQSVSRSVSQSVSQCVGLSVGQSAWRDFEKSLLG